MTDQIDILLEPFNSGNYNITIANQEITIPQFSTSPCDFDSHALLESVSVLTVAADWIETQFEFIELFWKVYGSLLTQN